MPTPLPDSEVLPALLEAEADRVETVKIRLSLFLPFWASILLQTRLVPCVTLPTYGATDCVDHIYYNPLLTRRLNLKRFAFLLIHECAHIALEHGPRRHGRAPEKWNRATDYVVNLIALDAKAEQLNGGMVPVGEFIPNGLLDETFRGQSSEEVYDQIPDPPENTGDAEDFGGGIDVHYPPPTDPDVADRLLEKLLKAHAQWEASGKRGHIPAGVLRRVENLRASAVPWQRTLRQWAVQCLSHDEWTLSPPHRRHLIRDEIWFPSLRGERCGSLVVLADTSGSIDHEALVQTLSELVALSDLADDLLFLSHDAAVQDVVTTHQLPTYLAQLRTGHGGTKGGGGTDHRPAFAWIAEYGYRPDLLIAFTDMDSCFPDAPPPYPVLWCVWPKDAEKLPPFGRLLVVRPPDH